MPKILGLNSLGVLVASVVFFIVGWLWYGVVFVDSWMAEMGIPASEGEDMAPTTLILGFIITVMEVIGIGLVLNWKNAAGINGALKTAGVLWLLFALPFCAYGYLYGASQSLTLLMIDGGHLLVGWALSAVILTMMK